jgi:hypothetical protein
MEGLDALLAVMYYCVLMVFLYQICAFISMPCINYDGNCFQKSKHLVKRVDPEMDGK